MKKTFLTRSPLTTILGLAMLASAALPSHAQFVRNTNRTIAIAANSTQGEVDTRALATRARLAKALPVFWATTQPGQNYMIFATMIRRGIDGTVTSNEKSGPYTFSPETTVDDVQANAPEFVALLLGQYATQDRVALAELTTALHSYFDSTRPGEGTALNGGQTMRNSDGTATFTDGKIIFVFDEGTSALTVATMAPALALALSSLASAIETGAATGGYALRDPSNASQLINFDGRMYDTAGNALPNASSSVVAALFGNGNGGRGSTASSSGGRSSASSNAAGNSVNGSGSASASANVGSSGSNNGSSGMSGSGSAGGNGNASGYNTLAGNGSSNGSSNGSNNGSNNGSSNASNNGSSNGTGGSSGVSSSNTGGSTPGTNGESSGMSVGNVNGTGLNGNTPLSTSGATGIANSNFKNNGTSSDKSANGSVCQVFRVLGSGGSTSCNN